MKFWSGEIVRNLQIQQATFDKELKKYKRVKMLDADVWELPTNAYLLLNSVKGIHQVVERMRAKVLLDYKPQNDEELSLKKGDVVMDVIELENGWWQGNLNGQLGYFPGDFVEFLGSSKNTDVSVTETVYLNWTEGVQQTAKSLQYRKTNNVKSDQSDGALISETSSMYIRDLAKVKETYTYGYSTVRRQNRSESLECMKEDAKGKRTKKEKHKKGKCETQDDEQLLMSFDSQTMSPENELLTKDNEEREEKRKAKDDKHTKEHKESIEQDFTEYEKVKKKRNKRELNKKQEGKENHSIKDKKKSLTESSTEISLEMTEIKRKSTDRKGYKEKKESSKQRDKKHTERQDETKQSLAEKTDSESQLFTEIKKTKKQKQKSKEVPRTSNSGSSAEGRLVQEKQKQERQHKGSQRHKKVRDDKKKLHVQTSESEISIGLKQKQKQILAKEEQGKQKRRGKQYHLTQSDTPDIYKEHKKGAKGTKHRVYSDEQILQDSADKTSESEIYSTSKKHSQRKRGNQKEHKQKRPKRKSTTESVESESSSSKQRRKKTHKHKESKARRSKEAASDDDEQKHGQRKRDQKEQQQKRAKRKSTTESTESEASSSKQRKKKTRKNEKSKGRQSKEAASDVQSSYDDEQSITISDIEFLTDSEKNKPKRGIFKKLFKW